MKRTITFLLLAVFFAACSDGSIDGTPEYQAKKAEEDHKKADGEKSLFAKLDDYASLKAPKQEDRSYRVSEGSAVVLTRMPSGDLEMEGWKRESDGTLRRCLESAGCKGSHPNVITDHFRAESAEEAKTLVRVNCEKGKEITDLQGEFSFGTLYGVNCRVELIDLGKNVTVASTEIKADKVKSLTDAKIVASNEYIKPVAPEKDYLVNPFPSISDFVLDPYKK